MTSLVIQPTSARGCAGFDWSNTDHAVCILDTDGRVLARKAFEHTTPGLARMVRLLYQRCVDEIAIERGDGPVLDTLLAAGLVIVVVTPNQVRNLRSRYGSAGNKDDRFDAHSVTSLPRSGTVRAARLLAEIGAARGRFPTADSLACLAGVAPSTRQSGKVKAVTLRWSADKELRDAICDFAGDSRRANPWAAELCDRARQRRHDHPHAVRILARAWVDIIWRCWQDGVAYVPENHPALRRVLAQSTPQAA